MGGVPGEVFEFGIILAVFGEEFVGIVLEVEELGFADGAVENVEFDELPVTFPDGAHPGFGAAGVGSEHDVAHALFFAGQDGFEADAFVGGGGFDACEVAKGGEGVHEVDVALNAARFDAGAFDDVGDPPGVFVEVLFSLKPVATDGHAVIRGVDNVSVVEFTHCFEFFEDAANLDIDVFGAGILAAELVADGGFIAVFPDAGDFDFIAKSGVAVGKGVDFEVVDGEFRLLGVESGEGISIAMIFSSVFGEEFGLSVSLVVWMREAEVDEERLFGFPGLAVTEVVHDLLAVPVGTGLVGFAALGGVFDNLKLAVGKAVAVATFAGAHRLVAGLIENFGESFWTWLDRCGVPFFGVLFQLPGNAPDALAGHDHGSGAGADCATPGAHVVGAIEDKAPFGEAVDVGGNERGFGIVNL